MALRGFVPFGKGRGVHNPVASCRSLLQLQSSDGNPPILIESPIYDLPGPCLNHALKDMIY